MCKTRIALGIEYNGSRFNGYQLQQPGTRTVQAKLEMALSKVANQTIRVTCAGRTDTGVHATGQVVHFDTTARRKLKAWVAGTNAQLPEDVRVRWSRQVEDSFSARFSATARSYRYILFMSEVRPAILANNVSWSFAELDVTKMHQAAQLLLGEKDFSAFRASQCQARHARRCVQQISLRQSGPYVLMDIQANAFLHHMVRNIMGSLMVIGCHERPVDWLKEVLNSRDRNQAGITAPAAGLYMVNVQYPQLFGLPPRTGWLPAFG